MSITARTQRSSTPQSGRFGRPSPAPRRSSSMMRRRPPQQSGMQQAFGAVSGAVPGLGGRTSSPSGTRGGKAGGIALLTAAAGFAFQNRDKLTSMLRRNRSQQPSTPPAPTT